MSNTFLRFARYQVAQVLARVLGHAPLFVSIRHLEEAKTAHQLTKAMNKIQSSLWKLRLDERLLASQRVTDILSQRVLKASDASLKLVAADWLRFLMQEGVIARPETVFVTLVTAIMQAFPGNTRESAHELRTYLRLIFESFWPFHAPDAAYPLGVFPSIEVFYPLIPLLHHADPEMQTSLLNIFTQLPALDNVEIEEHLPPLALIELSRAGPERQRGVSCIPTWLALRISRHNLQ